MEKSRILIVDDESETSTIIRDMLEDMGYSVIDLVSSGEDAIRKTLQFKPDLVLMDILLEGEMDGVEAARQIHDNIDTPVVYITGYVDDDILDRAKLTDPHGYIMKPFEESDLHATIEIALYRHKLEKLLKKSEKRYKTVCELTSDYIFHINVGDDKQMLFDFITDGFAGLTGYTTKDVPSSELWKKIIFPDDIVIVDKALQNIIRGNEEKYEFRIITKEGKTLWLVVNARPEWDINKQNVIGIIGAVSNITESKLSEVALIEAKQKAEAANYAKSAFLSNMSHELKTPLNSVIGFSELLLGKSCGEINGKQEKYLNNIYKSGNHLLKMINDIINLSKIEAGKIELELKESSLPRILNETVATLKPAAIKKNIEIKIRLNKELPTINVDEIKLRKILNILLDNAVKFTPDGGKINIVAVSIEDKIRVSVTDTGIGVKPEDQKRIFKGFEQVDSSYKRKYPGTGLGLALAKKLVKIHGGEIWIESPPDKGMALETDKGCSFLFTIPCKPLQPEPG